MAQDCATFRIGIPSQNSKFQIPNSLVWSDHAEQAAQAIQRLDHSSDERGIRAIARKNRPC
jgi:hypothetical protein